MGPYYRNTSQGVGSFINLFYEHPILMFILVASVVSVGIFFWRKYTNK